MWVGSSLTEVRPQNGRPLLRGGGVKGRATGRLRPHRCERDGKVIHERTSVCVLLVCPYNPSLSLVPGRVNGPSRASQLSKHGEAAVQERDRAMPAPPPPTSLAQAALRLPSQPASRPPRRRQCRTASSCLQPCYGCVLVHQLKVLCTPACLTVATNYPTQCVY